MKKINMKNILAGVGTVVVLFVAVYIGIYSNAGYFSGNQTQLNNEINVGEYIMSPNEENRGDGDTFIKIIKEVEPGSSPYGFYFELKAFSNPIGSFFTTDNNGRPINPNNLGFNVKPGVSYTITEINTQDPKGLDNYATKYSCNISSDITQTATLIEGYGRSVVLTPKKGDQIICTFTNDSSPSIIAFTDFGAQPQPKSSSLINDEETVTAGYFKFSSIGKSYKVQDLNLTIADATVAQKVELYDGATLIASRVADKIMNFSGLSIDVPANTSKTLTVKLVLGKVGTNFGNSGSSQLITLTEFFAVDQSTGIYGAGKELDPKLSQLYVYAGIPEIISSGFTSGDLILGTQKVYKFDMLSFGQPGIYWKKISFNINKSINGVDTLSNPVLRDEAGNQIKGNFIFTGGVEKDNGTSGNLVFVASSEQYVTNKVYHLYLTVKGDIQAGDLLSVNISQPSQYKSPNTYANVSSTPATFVWSDLSDINHSLNTKDWNNDYLIDTLPSSVQSLIRF